MRSDLIKVSIVGWTEKQWLDYRSTGIGGSEVSAIMGLSQYKSSLQLYLEKTGQWQERREEKISTYMGKRLEDFIAEEWQYYTDDQMSIIFNRQNPEFIPRKCRRINAYVRNPDIPHMFASLDRIINKGQLNMLTSEINEEEGILEIKTINEWEAKKWDSGIPVGYVMQLQSYLAIFDLPYGEIAIMKDGRYIDVIAFERNQGIIDQILEKTTEFWERVEKGRVLVAQKKEAEKLGDEDALAEIQYQLDILEPEADGSDGYSAFMKERYANPVTDRTMQGEMKHVQLALERLQLKKAVDDIEYQIAEKENLIKADMKEAVVLDCGVYGKITWKANAKGTRTFLANNIKEPQQ